MQLSADPTVSPVTNTERVIQVPGQQPTQPFAQPSDQDDIIPIMQERVVVTRALRETGRVRVSLKTETVEQDVEEVLHGETIAVTTVPVGRELAVGEAAPQPHRAEDGAWVIPVIEEVLIIERRLVLKEELHLHTRRTVETVREVVALRRQTATVEELPPEPENPKTPNRSFSS